jgi:hypothetical protein
MLPLKFPNTTRAPEKENFLVLRLKKDWTDPEILCSNTPIVMGNFYGNVLAQKRGQNAKRPDFQTLFWSQDWVAFDLLLILNAMFCENEPSFPHLECYLPLSLLLADASCVRLYKQKKLSLKNPPLFLSAFLDSK